MQSHGIRVRAPIYCTPAGRTGAQRPQGIRIVGRVEKHVPCAPKLCQSWGAIMNQCSQERRRVRVGQRGHGATGPGKKDPSLGGVLPGLLRLQQGTPMRTRPCWSLGSFWNDYPNSVPYSLRQIRLEESKHEDDHLTSQQGNGTKRCPIQS